MRIWALRRSRDSDSRLSSLLRDPRFCEKIGLPERWWNGVVAQLVERLVRNEKVAGSIPVGSTILRSELLAEFRAKDGALRSRF